jgi:uncharacterized membrane protein YjjP (DUF1212 family)
MLIGSSFHRYGASADRIEDALNSICEKIGVEGHFFSLPTSISASFKLPNGDRVTRMERLDPGKINLSKLCMVDEVIEGVLSSELSLSEGVEEIQTVLAKSTQYNKFWSSVSHGVIACSVCLIVNGSYLDILLSLILGVVVGTATENVRKERLDSILDGVLAFAVSFLSYIASYYFKGINPGVVTLSSLIVLVPGLMFTTAIRELTTQNLTAGTARIVGSFMIMVKLSLGAYMGKVVVENFLFSASHPSLLVSHHPALLVASLIFISLGLTLSFQAKLKDYWLIASACFFSFYTSWYFLDHIGNVLGIFVVGILIASTSNLVSRILKIPAMLFLLPAIILLVPGSLGHKGLSLIFEKNLDVGLYSIFEMIQLGVVLVGGVFFGTSIVKPKKYL